MEFLSPSFKKHVIKRLFECWEACFFTCCFVFTGDFLRLPEMIAIRLRRFLFPEIRQKSVRKRQPELEVREGLSAGDADTSYTVWNSGKGMYFNRNVVCKQAWDHVIQVLHGRIFAANRKERRRILYLRIVIRCSVKARPIDAEKSVRRAVEAVIFIGLIVGEGILNGLLAGIVLDAGITGQTAV